MAHTWVSTVKLPGDSTAREIVPYKVGVSNSSDVVVTLPSTLNTNAEFLINKIEQTGIQGFKGFDSGIGLYDDAMGGYWHLEADEGFWVTDYGDNTIVFDIVNRSLYWENGIDYTYDFPTRSGTIGLQIDIVDLTAL